MSPRIHRARSDNSRATVLDADPQLPLPPLLVEVDGLGTALCRHASVALLSHVLHGTTRRISLTLAVASEDSDFAGFGLILTPDPASAREIGARLISYADEHEQSARDAAADIIEQARSTK